MIVVVFSIVFAGIILGSIGSILDFVFAINETDKPRQPLIPSVSNDTNSLIINETDKPRQPLIP